MKWIPSKKEQNKEDLLDEWLSVIPTRHCEFLVNEDQVTLLLPRSRNKILKSILNMFNSSPHVKVKLDARGSFIWLNCDSQHSIRQICDLLIKQFGEEVNPVEERTVMFFKQLYRFGLVKFYKPKV